MSKELTNLDTRIGVRVFKVQLQEIRKQMKKYPFTWNNRSHFIRASINHFVKYLNSGDFKYDLME